MTAKQDRETRQIEMVETHNLALSLKRLHNAPGYDERRWKRALYHALGMAFVTSGNQMEKLRQAMELP